MKVLFITNVPSPYRVNFFNELGKYCNLTVTFEKETSTERDKSWKEYSFENFKGMFLKGISINTDTALCFGLKKLIKKGKFDKIICANLSSPTSILAIRYMKRKKIPYSLESDGAFKGCGNGIRERLKRYVISGAKECYSTNCSNDEYFEYYGAKKENIKRYPFTSLYEKDILKQVLSVEEKLQLRNELNITEEKVILSVGQFIYRKGFDLMLNALKDIDKNVGVYIVGGKATEEYLQLKEQNGLTNVHFVGFKIKEELKKYYKAADLFVLPTREDIWGLVINEAMANALPIITTDRCGAGLALVDEQNGRIVPVDDTEALSKAIKEVLACSNYKQMGQKSLDKIKNYTIENMSKEHLEQ